MKKIIASIVFSCFATCLYSQGFIKSIDTKVFPQVSLCVHSFNPDTLVKEDIHVYEDGKEVKIKPPVNPISPSSTTKKSNVLFLWDLKGISRPVLRILYDFFGGMQIVSPKNEDIKVNVAVFRRDEKNSMEYRTLLSSFNNNYLDVQQKIAAEGGKELKDYSSSTDIIWTIEQAIKKISVQPVDEAKAIFVFTVGKIDNSIDATSTLNLAKEKRIHLYLINIDGDEQDENVCRNIANRTYGMFLSVKSKDAFAAQEKRQSECKKDENGEVNKDINHPFWFAECEIMNTWMTNLPKRWDGVTYNISFNSNCGRIGQTKPLKIEIGQDVINQSYEIPGFSLAIWIKTNIIWFIVILVFSLSILGVGLFFLIRFLRDRAEDKREAEEQIEKERKRLKTEQESLRRKLEIAESEQRRKLEQEIRKDKDQKRQEYLYSINSIMKAKNIKLRLLVSSMSGSSEYIIDEPETTIGTAENNDVVLDDPTVSRHHAVLYFNGEIFGIRDLKSTNGVVMNGFRVDDLKLRNGDSVSLGKTTIKVYF